MVGTRFRDDKGKVYDVEIDCDHDHKIEGYGHVCPARSFQGFIKKRIEKAFEVSCDVDYPTEP